MVPHKCIKPFYKYKQNLEKEGNRKNLTVAQFIS